MAKIEACFGFQSQRAWNIRSYCWIQRGKRNPPLQNQDNWKAEWRWYHHCIETAQETEWNICVYGWTRFFLRPTVKSSFSCPWTVWLWPRYIVSLSFSFHVGNSVNLIGPLWCYHQTLPIPCLLLTRCPSLSNSFPITLSILVLWGQNRFISLGTTVRWNIDVHYWQGISGVPVPKQFK